MNSFKLLKIRAIMKRFGCSAEEAAIIKKTGVAPKPKKVVVPVKVRPVKKEIKETIISLNDEEAK